VYEFAVSASSKAELYHDLHAALDALTADEPDTIANMANAAALIWQYLPDLNWSGFYRLVEGELVLGPFQGKPACIRIAIGAGVCGAAAGTRETQLVADVHGLRYQTSNRDDAFTVAFADVETFTLDYLQKTLRVKKRGGRTWNFTTRAANADPLLVFQRDVDRARARLAH